MTFRTDQGKIRDGYPFMDDFNKRKRINVKIKTLPQHE